MSYISTVDETTIEYFTYFTSIEILYPHLNDRVLSTNNHKSDVDNELTTLIINLQPSSTIVFLIHRLLDIKSEG
uniref:Uncharacterized protein n=1 Tax=Brugia pahangi TaxID=6280 RepID=A0A0N4TMF3_BRUPA